MRAVSKWVVLGFVCLVLGGCSTEGGDGNPFATLAPPADPAPVADSPEGVLRRLEWAIEHRSIEVYRELFTADFEFVFAAPDTNGNTYRDRPFTREDELLSAANLFASANEIRMNLASDFSVFCDPRPSSDCAVHKNIRTTLSLMVTTPDGSVITCEGSANFFLVHEDSALVTDDLRELVERPGVTWFIQRWEDETYRPAVAFRSTAPLPSSYKSLGAIKRHYLTAQPIR